MIDPLKSVIQSVAHQAPTSRANRTFYIDNDTYAWLQERFGSSRGVSQFVRNLLRKCMESDTAENNDEKEEDYAK